MARFAVLLLSLLVCLVSDVIALDQAVAAIGPPPVVIIPGDGSNQLEARLNKPSKPHWYCWQKTSEWSRLWLNTADLLLWTECWADNIRVDVDPQTGRGQNAPGVETRVPGFGDTASVEELDPLIPFHKTAAFRELVAALEGIGLKKNVTLRAAPYDFRFTPDRLAEIDGYGSRLRALVEETYANAGNRRVAIVSHSMGGLHALYFLQQQSTAWLRRYIEKFVPVSAPWLGAAKEFRLFGSGDSEGLPVDPAKIKGEQRSYETNHWLSPAAHGFTAWGSQIFATAPNGTVTSYTAADWDAFLRDAGYDAGVPVMQRVRELIRVDPTTGVPELPGVETSGSDRDGSGPAFDVTCIISGGVATPEQFTWSSKEGLRRGEVPVTKTGDGDGTVNTKSLEACEAWTHRSLSGVASTTATTVQMTRLKNIEHSLMIRDEEAIKAIVAALLPQDMRASLGLGVKVANWPGRRAEGDILHV